MLQPATVHTIGLLTVVAGPTAIGKSYLLRRLGEDDLLRQRFGLANGAVFRRAVPLAREPVSAGIDHLVLHYDIIRPFYKGVSAYEHDPNLAVLDRAERIAFFTLRATPERLRNQIDLRIAEAKKPRKRFFELRSLYATDALGDTYDRWLSFVAGFTSVTVGNYLVDVDQGYALTPLDRSV